jgi:putative hydrolase of the HAD superfamily
MPNIEPLTPEEKEAFLSRARAEGRSLTSEEQYALFGPPPAKVDEFRSAEVVDEMEAAHLDAAEVAGLAHHFFPELGDDLPGAPRLVRGIIFDLQETLAILNRPLDELLAQGAADTVAYMRSTGMDLPADFAPNVVEARRFAEEKSEEENEEHLADDALSFLLQFFGFPASRMDPTVLQRAIDIFYAPEMTAWRLRPGARELLATLHAEGYKIGVMANYNADRVFQRTVDYLGIRPWLDLCITSAAVEYRKPDPKFFEIALEQWDALPYEVVVVGDSRKEEIAGAIETGCLSVLLEAEGQTPQVAHDNAQLAAGVRPDAVIHTLDELPALIAEWAAP